MKTMNIDEIVSQLTLEEKAALCSGQEMFATAPIERLGIPAIELADGPHGLRKQTGKQDFMGQNKSVTATCFPVACAVGSSFNPALAEEMGQALGQACQAENVQVLLGPGINIKRSPLCGRNFEYFSEDPLVSGTMGAAYVRGVQAQGVGACLKHFFANNQETRRRTENSELDETTMREIYLPAFEQVIREAKPWAVMSSYNKVNGRYVNETPKWNKEVLRKEFGFDGMTVSDWAAVHDRVAALVGGTNLTMPADKAHDALLVEAVRNGTLPEADLDVACKDIITLALKAADNRRPNTNYDFEAAHTLARRIAAECMVLLKNEDKILPLNKTRRIALIGKFAAEPRYQGAGSSHVNAYKVPALTDITADLPNVSYSEGFDMTGIPSAEKQNAAVSAAQAAEIAVIFAGLPPIMESEGFDRWVMKLPQDQNELIEKICAVQPNTIVVLQNGGPVELPWADKPKAILEVYLGGEAVSEAIWDVLTGAAAPSGHLAETFPLQLEDNPSYLSWPGSGNHVPYQEGVFVGYRYYTTRHMPVRYPFGYGLTYTEFSYTDLTLSADTFKKGDTLQAEVTVTNTGKRAGKALIQLYIGTKLGAIAERRPVRELRAFEKIELQPGESRRVTLTLGDRAFSHWDSGVHSWRVMGGAYTVEIGTSAQDIVLSASVNVEDEYIPDGRTYDIMTSLEDALRHPAGRAFWEKIQPQLNAVMAHMNGGGQTPMPYGDEMPASVGLTVEPLQTLKRLLPMIKEEEWNVLFKEMNR